jgi:hypothetical protein
MNEPIPPLSSPPLSSQPKTSNLAIWSFTLGIVSLVCCGVIAGIPGVICGHKAMSEIKSSAGRLAGEGFALAGLILGYIGIFLGTIGVIGFLAAIAIPNFVKARATAQENACINNLRQIEAAKNEWALEKNQDGGAVPTESDLTPYLDRHIFPVCPAGGTYSINAVTNPPTCSVPGHSLERLDTSGGN